MSEKKESLFDGLPEDASAQDLVERLKQAAAEDDKPLDPAALRPAEDEPQEQIEPLKEGARVQIEGKVMSTRPDDEGKDIVMFGKIRGIAPIKTPFGIVGYDYIVELENPEVLPTEGNERYPYTCITIDMGACTEVEDDGS